MERLKVWLNQQTAKILGDVKEREPAVDPSPARAGCRIFFMVSLLLGFSLLLAYNFVDAPDARVVQMHNLKPGDKNHAFPSCFLNNRSSPDCKKWSTATFPLGIPVSCPCTNVSAPWKNLVKFYVLHETSTYWNMSFTEEALQTDTPEITAPADFIRLGNEDIVKDTEFLTAEIFCSLSSMYPFARNSTTPGYVRYIADEVTEYPNLLEHCVWMATLLFPGSNKNYEDRTRSTQFLNTPSLLNREGLNTLVAQLARDSVLTRRLALDMAYLNVGNENFPRFYNALAHLLKGLLDRDEMDQGQSYIYGANELSLTLSSNQVYDDYSKVWYVGDNRGPIFLQPEIDWEAYRQACFPQYCEVIKPMGGARRLYWSFGILGGVATVVLAVVTKLLWPCTALLLLCIFKGKAAAVEDPERPKNPLMHDPRL